MDGRVAIISGAAGAAGRAVAARLASDGAALVLLGRQGASLDALADELALGSDRSLQLTADLRDNDAAAGAVEEAFERFGRIDVLAHLVGGFAAGASLVELEPTQLREMLEQHAWTTFNLARAVVPHMTAAGWGRVVAVTPTTVATPGPNMAAYAAAKAAQETLLMSLARELKGTGVTANAIVVRGIDADRSGKAGLTSPEAIAAMVAYLCTDDGGAINGARLPLTGA